MFGTTGGRSVMVIVYFVTGWGTKWDMPCKNWAAACMVAHHYRSEFAGFGARP